MAIRKRSPTFEEVFTRAGIIPEWIERGRVQGLKQGLKQGMERGMEQGRYEVARKMKEMGDPIEKIHAITGLPTETIEQM